MATADVGMNGWRNLLDVSIKRSRKVRGGNYVQIATVDQNGNPHCRTVVFRGFSTIGGKEYMRMITDGRSEKVGHIQSNPKCEMCWWFQKVQKKTIWKTFGEMSLLNSFE